jgi:membrane glycosyltransferase
MGAFAYIVSAIWAASLAVGVVLALQGQQMLPSYFLDSKTLFPIWPVIDPGAAMRLFLATMAVVLFPKALGLALEIKRASRARELFGMPRAFAGVAIEAIFSMLLAPILMMTQTASVLQIAFGQDSGWKAQRRDAEGVEFMDALHFHWRHTLAGTLLALLCWEASPGLLVWMSPVVLGLILSGPLSWLTAQPAGPALSVLLSTPSDRSPASILLRVRRHTAAWTERLGTLASVPGPKPVPQLRRAA